MPGHTCPACRGRGRIFQRGSGPLPCPRCSGTNPRAQSALISLAESSAVWREGRGSEAALDLAVRRASNAGATVEQIIRTSRLPEQMIRAILDAEGRETLF